jgi:hypothetical protein
VVASSSPIKLKGALKAARFMSGDQRRCGDALRAKGHLIRNSLIAWEHVISGRIRRKSGVEPAGVPFGINALR